MNNRQQGFTLVEIAIVLVIIGLLLGGVLKGQEIITNAKIKNLENDFNGLSAAIYSYQDRYRALPGDDSGAGRFSDVSTQVGNGNGQIEGDFKGKIDTEETRLFWLHLRNAGLVAGATNPASAAGTSPFQQPSNAFGGITGAASSTSLSGLFIGFSNIPRDIAVILESRSDDEQPNKGSIRTDKANYDNEGLYDMYFSL